MRSEQPLTHELLAWQVAGDLFRDRADRVHASDRTLTQAGSLTLLPDADGVAPDTECSRERALRNEEPLESREGGGGAEGSRTSGLACVSGTRSARPNRLRGDVLAADIEDVCLAEHHKAGRVQASRS
jgi:hypothetical protein